MNNLLIFPNKRLRSLVVIEHVVKADYPGIVIFTCGNAAQALRDLGYEVVVEVGPKGNLTTDRWWTPAEIHKTWPHLFDATSGHLPIPLMLRIAEEFKHHLGQLKETQYNVPTGSGETILCLRWAYPSIQFNPVYNLNEATQYNKEAPLNWAVRVGSMFVTM